MALAWVRVGLTSVIGIESIRTVVEDGIRSKEGKSYRTLSRF